MSDGNMPILIFPHMSIVTKSPLYHNPSNYFIKNKKYISTSQKAKRK